MPITIQTANPTKLLADIKKGIDDNKIETWSYDKDGDFTHTPVQWNGKAWLKPTVAATLNFAILGQKDIKLEDAIYAVYHGRFAEMVLAHFKAQITSISLS